MAEFSDIIQTLRGQERDLEAQLSRVRAARQALESVGASSSAGAPAQPRGRRRAGRQSEAAATGGGGRPRKKFSAATRAKMAAAQRARWAKAKSAKKDKD
jgi:hypothetical protein